MSLIVCFLSDWGCSQVILVIYLVFIPIAWKFFPLMLHSFKFILEQVERPDFLQAGFDFFPFFRDPPQVQGKNHRHLHLQLFRRRQSLKVHLLPQQPSHPI